METSSSLYIIYAIIKNKQDFKKTGSLYKNKNYLDKKKFFQKIFFVIEKMDVQIEKKMPLNMDEIYITEIYKKLRSHPNRKRINNYIYKKFWV